MLRFHPLEILAEHIFQPTRLSLSIYMLKISISCTVVKIVLLFTRIYSETCHFSIFCPL